MTCSAPQSDQQNFSFMEDIHVISKTMARNGHKSNILVSCKFWQHPLRERYKNKLNMFDFVSNISTCFDYHKRNYTGNYFLNKIEFFPQPASLHLPCPFVYLSICLCACMFFQFVPRNLVLNKYVPT